LLINLQQRVPARIFSRSSDGYLPIPTAGVANRRRVLVPSRSGAGAGKCGNFAEIPSFSKTSYRPFSGILGSFWVGGRVRCVFLGVFGTSWGEFFLVGVDTHLESSACGKCKPTGSGKTGCGETTNLWGGLLFSIFRLLSISSSDKVLLHWVEVFAAVFRRWVGESARFRAAVWSGVACSIVFGCSGGI